MTEADEIVSELGYRPFDADNHYYEAEDAFTRHLDPTHGQRVIELVHDRQAQVAA